MGVLKAKVGGSWENVIGGPGKDEVYIGPDDPGALYDLWYDTDAPDTYPTWIAPTLLNGWVNYGAPYVTAGYRKVGDIVYLRGLIRNGTLSTNVMVLPVGYRPSATWHVPIISNDLVATCIVGADGSVYFHTNASTLWGSLASVQFSVTA